VCWSFIFLEGVLFGRRRRQIACSILGSEVMGSASLALDTWLFGWRCLGVFNCAWGVSLWRLRPYLASGVFMVRPWGSKALQIVTHFAIDSSLADGGIDKPVS
jgi:hypothetical protein